MKVIVIGLGSMGKRRIRLLKERKDVEIFGIDTQMERVKQQRRRPPAGRTHPR